MQKVDVWKKDTMGWMNHFGIKRKDIMSPDGWDRTNIKASFNESITLDEFDERIRRSSMCNNPAVQRFLNRNDE